MIGRLVELDLPFVRVLGFPFSSSDPPSKESPNDAINIAIQRAVLVVHSWNLYDRRERVLVPRSYAKPASRASDSDSGPVRTERAECAG